MAGIFNLIYKVPFVLEVQDILPEVLQATGFITNNSILKLIEKLGLFVYSKAKAITVHSPGSKKCLENKGIPGAKIEVFYNWAYENEFSLIKPDTSLSKKLGLEGYFNILFAGNIGPAQGLDNVIKAASLLTDLKDLQFILLGSGIESDRVKQLFKDYNLNNVRFLPRLPLEKMPSIYALVYVVMIHLTDHPIFEVTIPGKTQSCLLSGRPVIVSVSGEAKDLVINAGAGLAVKPMDAEDLAKVARKFYYMPPEEREAIGKSGRKYYFQNLASEVQIKRYESLFNKIAKRAIKTEPQ